MRLQEGEGASREMAGNEEGHFQVYVFHYLCLKRCKRCLIDVCSQALKGNWQVSSVRPYMS